MNHNYSTSTIVTRSWLGKLSRLVLTLTLLAILVSSTFPVALAQSAPQGGISASSWAKMPTPTRIDSAFERGIIDAETRILYMAYAVNDESLLPEAYRGTVGWFGTSTVRELYDVYASATTKSLSPQIFSELDRFYGPQATSAATICDKEDGDVVDTTSSTRFTINYYSSDANAIGGGLTLADYAAALDTSYNGIVGSYGWARTPVCEESGINCNGASVPGTKFPVQVFDLGTSLFGYVTTNGGTYAGFQVNDNPYTPQTETASTTSCMVLNSNFAQLGGGGALGNLNGTASHEFVHAIQNAWGDPGEQMVAMWAESTAAYFEDEIFDSANSQYIYLYGDFNKNSLNDWGAGTDGQKDYENFIFFRYITEQYGGANSSTGGEKVIQKFFENVATSTPAVDQELASFKAAVESFALGGGSGSSVFADVFHKFAIAAKFMKDCQDEAGYGSAYCYEEGTEYRAAARNFQEAGNVPAVVGTIGSTTGSIAGTIKSDYGVNWVRLPAKGNAAYKIDLSATATTSMKASVVCDTGSAFAITAFPQLITGTTAQSVASFNPAACNDVVLVVTNQMESAAGGASVAHGYTVQLGAVAALDQYVYLPMLAR